MLALLSLIFSVALAHNWVSSPSRVPFAATVFPCMPPRNNFPHVQVAQNQGFQIEWSTGHDRFVYFVLIKKNESDFLENSDENELDRYFSQAPQQLMGTGNYKKYHRTWKAPTDTHALGGPLSNYYARLVPTTDPNYLPRPDHFGPTDYNLYEYPAASTTNDRYVAYHSATYPWIVAAWRFEITQADAGEVDTALFRIPTQATVNGGDFIIHYLWSGYYDCIDVNVLPTTTTTVYPYGKTLNGTDGIAINRIDHCIFDTPYQYFGIPRLVFGAYKYAHSVCTESCRDTYEDGCGGVTVFPFNIWNKNYGPHWNPNNNIIKNFYEQAWNTSWDSSFNHDTGIPYESDTNGVGWWRVYTYTTTSMGMQNANYDSVNQTTVASMRALTESSPDPWVCVMVQPRYATTTKDKFTVSDDPLDPVWYSTCYEVTEQLQFIGFNATLNEFVPHIPYKSHSGQCISCEDAAAWSDADQVPKWATSKCRMCERDVPTPKPVKPYLKRISTSSYPDEGNYAACDAEAAANGLGAGMGSEWCLPTWESYHWLMDSSNDRQVYWQQPNHFRHAEQCAAFLATQPQCSSLSVFGERWYGCRCVRNTTCCLNNLISQPATWSVNQMWESRATAPADPTCSTGILNTARTVCCKGTATTCPDGCGSTAWSQQGGAMCVDSVVPPERKCADSSPPCTMR